MIEPKFDDMTNDELKQVLNSFIINLGNLTIGYRPDHNYSPYALKIMEDMYPSIFIQFMNEAKRRNLTGTPLTDIKDGAWIYMIEGLYTMRRNEHKSCLSDGSKRIIPEVSFYGEPTVLYL